MPEEHGSANEEMVKVRFQLAEPTSHVSAETIWAAKISEGEYEIRNSPWWVYGLSFGDVVTGEESPNGWVEYGRLLRHGGHRTLRVIFDTTDTERREHVLKMINSYGAFYEQARSASYSIDVPPDAHYESIFAELAALEELKVLSFEIGSDGTGAPRVAENS